ncbi:MAG TPA: helix-hairpin-helix domain-containing protein, partial [Bacteroidales bacterium]|nr:helix-hairpin-helix domain-containing protein [Bacteroidales bacterium]
EHLVSRRAMDINAAEATIDALYRKNLVHDAGDLYALTKENLLSLERFADKSAQKLMDSINQSRQVPFPRVLYALGIRFVGETVAKTLASRFRSIDKLARANYEDLVSIDEIGDRIARSVLNYFSNPRNMTIIQKLKQAGVNMKMQEEEKPESQSLQGKTIVISGTFGHYSRKELQEIIGRYGGKNTSSVSSNTDYLLAGENTGSKKLEQAEKNNVPVISEEEFLKMIGN